MSRTAPSRAHDPVYDPVYTVSTSGGSFRKGVYRATSNLPSTSSISNNQNATEGSQLVSGTQRVKFYRCPVLPHLQAEPPEVLLAPVYSVPIPPLKARDAQFTGEVVEESTRSVGIQTLFRDSEAQTDPYTPELIPKIDTSLTPEIATLAGLNYAHGQLPIGQKELNLIERNRKKRAFESSLPPMTDEANFLLRKTMLEARENREWAYREAEIDAIQAQRVALLEQALQEREKENAFLSEQRLEALRQRLLHENENALESMQQKRVTALRKLTKKRVQRQHDRGFGASKPEPGRDIITEYANFGSQVYAPVLRDGKVGRIDVNEHGLEKTYCLDIQAVLDLEHALPKRMLVPALSKFKLREKTGRTAKDRKQAAIETHLVRMETLINKSKEVVSNANSGQSRPKFVSSRSRQKQQPVVRPSTPEYAIVRAHDTEECDLEDAVRLLQKLLRGRAVQNMMFEGKERRAELIAELRAADEHLAQQSREAIVLEQNRGPDVMNRVAIAAKNCLEGEVVSETLDFLAKELARSREVAKLRGFVSKASEERRVREVEEGGRRQAEEMMREREDEVFRRVMQVHVETSRDFIDDVLEEVAIEQSHSQALQDLHTRSAGVDRLVQQVENEMDNDENIVRELVANFLLPHVQRQHERCKEAKNEKKYMKAAQELLNEMAVRMNQLRHQAK
ncbi:protein maats1 [Plasmopara halstedii]|uniref:Cilia- and flagella-associated protein 91 n=1 Tax=Plasmopara halstedii TaxID=4781 RepID=A0A0P1AIR8_PLAHL|nr:protein maats1 [Plasmopara halstedii]CEG40752.1 protein maats1 [Plasmopara halstedii]|eukprot:XP_024577121.1 protein maats1 [Plasmopara halstedii]